MNAEELLDKALKALASGDIRTMDLPAQVAREVYSEQPVQQQVESTPGAQEFVPNNDLEDKYVRAAQRL